MQYRVLCYGEQITSYGPFNSRDEAIDHADKYLQDFRTEIYSTNLPTVPYKVSWGGRAVSWMTIHNPNTNMTHRFWDERALHFKSQILMEVARLHGIPYVDFKLAEMQPGDLRGYKDGL